MAKNRGVAGPGRLLLGFVLGVLVAGGAGFLYLHRGSLWSARSEGVRAPDWSPHPQKAMPKESAHARTLTPPFGASEDAFEGGARVYRAECAGCHGTLGQNAVLSKTGKPAAIQLWKKSERRAGIGVSGTSPGDIYAKVANGVRPPSMPAYKRLLTETQMWQVSLLLANADKELPNPVRRILVDR